MLILASFSFFEKERRKKKSCALPEWKRKTGGWARKGVEKSIVI
jgi:hypothetical protein